MAKKETLFFLTETEVKNKFEFPTRDGGPQIFLNTETNEMEIIFTARGPKNPPQGDPPSTNFQKVRITSRIKKEREGDPVQEAKFTLSSPSLTYSFQNVIGGFEIGEYVFRINLNEVVKVEKNQSVGSKKRK